MNISFQWLKDYLKFDLDTHQLSLRLTGLGLEVEAVDNWESVKGGLKGFVIGEVLTCAKHPNADKLSVTTVNIGNGSPVQIVCGAPNVAAGQKVVVATVGTIVSKGAESFEIKRAKIRGEASEGMICAEDEMGLGTSHEGIMVLDPSAIPGTPASEYFRVATDTVFSIGLTPNRIDASSHFGVARDLAASLCLEKETRASLPSVDHFKVDNHELEIDVIIENEKSCPRYAGVSITGLTVKESPEWLQNRLRSIGLSPINNVVDATNYVLFELGQPLHAFDAAKIKGKKVVVKNLPAGTKFTTLDKVERTLSGEDLIICNAEEGMALAGVFGGLDSGITEATKDIFLESAYFNPVTTRVTARRHGLNTDASFRFERGTDPGMVPYALKRVALLITEIAGGKISSDIIDRYPVPVKEAEVTVRYAAVNSLIGKEIPVTTVKKIITSLEMEILQEDSSQLKLRIPACRVDVTREADVIEDILRIYGYNNVEVPGRIHATLSYSPKPDKEKMIHRISDYLTGSGFTEIMCNSLTRTTYYENNTVHPAERMVRILNPLSSDLGCMRQSLFYGGMETIVHNLNRKSSNLMLYEFGNVYFMNPDLQKKALDKYSEYQHLSLFLTGNRQDSNWAVKEEPVGFYYLKGWVHYILQRFGFSPEGLTVEEQGNALLSTRILYSWKEKLLVEFGQVHKNQLRFFDIRQDVYYAEFHWDAIMHFVLEHPIRYVELPKFPEVVRDLSMVLDEKVAYSHLRDLAFRTEKNLLKNVSLFDVYTGDKIGQGKKSYALSFTLQDTAKTLTDAEIDAIMNKLMKAYATEFGAVIRQ
ncbi:MAG: phenylalanine--tRNA ligase subunit beta [Bacteroidales bacterium]